MLNVKSVRVRICEIDDDYVPAFNVDIELKEVISELVEIQKNYVVDKSKFHKMQKALCDLNDAVDTIKDLIKKDVK